jgi:hypothetical protein
LVTAYAKANIIARRRLEFKEQIRDDKIAGAADFSGAI